MYTFADLCGPFNFIICGEQLNPFTVNPYPLSGQPSLISGILELWVAISVQNDDLVSKKNGLWEVRRLYFTRAMGLSDKHMF